MPQAKEIMERVIHQLDLRYEDLESWRKYVGDGEEQESWQNQKDELDALNADITEWLSNGQDT